MLELSTLQDAREIQLWKEPFKRDIVVDRPGFAHCQSCSFRTSCPVDLSLPFIKVAASLPDRVVLADALFGDIERIPATSSKFS